MLAEYAESSTLNKYCEYVNEKKKPTPEYLFLQNFTVFQHVFLNALLLE